jgi:hypothetical protein
MTYINLILIMILFLKKPKDHLFSHEIIEDEHRYESFNNDYEIRHISELANDEPIYDHYDRFRC